MKSVTNNFKEEIRKNGRQLDSKVTIDGLEFGKEVFNSITPKFNVSLFKTIMKGVEIDSNVFIPKNSKINVKSGVMVNKQYEYVDYGNYTSPKESEINEDTKSWKVTIYDKILDSMIDYDLQVEYPISVRNYWLAIFNRLNWDTSGIPETFTNSSKIIGQDVHSGIGYTFRDVLDELCSISGVWLVDINGIPTILRPNRTNETIDETYLSDTNVTIKQRVFFNSLVFSRAEESDNIFRKDNTSIEENGLHEYQIADNQLLSTNDRDLYIDELWEYLKTFQYYSFDIDTVGVMFLEPLDGFNIAVGTNTYPTILLNDETQITQGLKEILYSDTPKGTQTEYKYADTTDKKINQTYILVDKQNQKIESVVKNVNDNTTRITSVEQSVDKINQTVSQITIPLNNVIGNDIITLENTSNTDIYKMSIKGDISLLYGNNGNAYGDDVPYSQILYPSSNLFGKNNYLVIKYSDEDIQKIVLPFTYLNYINNEVCDEFKIDDGKAYIIRRVGVNSSMQKYQLEEEIIEEIPDFKIQLKEGNPTIYLESFDTVMFDVTYMVKNEYTDTFATKIELNSSITQTKDEIKLEVSKKVDKDEVVNTINVSTEEILIKGNRLVVEADNFKLDKDGTVKTNNGTFKNVTINGGKLNLSNGAEVVGDNGLITNLYFTSAGNMGSYQNLGFGQYYDQSNIVVYKSNTYLDIFIPENFVIKSAYLTIQHTPAKWTSSNSQEVTGYARNVKIYKILDGYSYEVDNVHSVIKINEAYLSEIPNALGVNSYTPDKITAGQVSNLTSVVNIRDYINGSGLTTLVAQTSDNLPQANSDIFSTSTGKAKLSVNIIGYMTFNN